MIYSQSNIKNVCIYLRLSRDEEGKGIEEVLRNHRQTLIDLVNKNNWSYEVFEEVASSKTISKRTEMVKLIKRIEQYHFDAIVVMDIDRLSRNEYDQSDIKRLLYNTGTYVVTPYRLYDLRSDEDTLLLGITGLIASQEYKMILKRMQRGKMFAQKKGHWTNGQPPLGYDKNPMTNKLVTNNRAEDVEYIFNQIVEGTSISGLLKQLELMGIKTKMGSPFRYNSIKRLVNNECYKGMMVSNRGIGKNIGVRPKEDWIVVHNNHEAIVSESVWEKANKIVNEYSFKAPRSKNRIYPTSNLLFCGQCGKVQGCNYHPHIDKFYVKVCSCGNRTFHYNPVLKMVKEKILDYKQEILQVIKGIDDGLKDDTTEYTIQQLTKQIEKVNKALLNIDFLFEEEEIDFLTYKERKATRQKQLEAIETELQQVKNRDQRVVKDALIEQMQVIEKLFGNWHFLDGKGLSDEEVNRLLHYLVDKIKWTYKKGGTEPKLEITYK
ncbi:recombinase family protein [Metabacillus sp. 113a]|uniref:recombinase family protein n=1 Tax=Metabacillus sp. 113a TaxID=3404706 RepID=UPI003CEE93A5